MEQKWSPGKYVFLRVRLPLILRIDCHLGMLTHAICQSAAKYSAVFVLTVKQFKPVSLPR